MHRGWMDNEVLKNNDERIVWLSIIERAAWTDTTTTVNGQEIKVPRGSFITSLRNLCPLVNWDAKKSQRFLAKLVKCHMIATANATGMTQVSVCNYEEYQSSGHNNATANAIEVPHKEVINKNKQTYNIIGWDDFISVYPSGLLENGKPRRWPKSGRDSAQNRFKEAVADGATPDQLILAAKNYAAEKSDGMYVKNPKKFLQTEWQEWLTVQTKSETNIFAKGWDYQ